MEETDVSYNNGNCRLSELYTKLKNFQKEKRRFLKELKSALKDKGYWQNNKYKLEYNSLKKSINNKYTRLKGIVKRKKKNIRETIRKKLKDNKKVKLQP
jgi:DNA polymerase II small subunit/DNA polymerase delta subunit B